MQMGVLQKESWPAFPAMYAPLVHMVFIVPIVDWWCIEREQMIWDSHLSQNCFPWHKWALDDVDNDMVDHDDSQKEELEV